MSDNLLDELDSLLLKENKSSNNKLSFIRKREEQIKLNNWLENNQSIRSESLGFGLNEDMSNFYKRMDLITSNNKRANDIRSKQRHITPQERAFKENNNVFDREDMIRRVDGEKYAARNDTLNLSDKEFRQKYGPKPKQFDYSHYKASIEGGNSQVLRHLPAEDVERFDKKYLDPKGTRRRRDRVQGKIDSNRWFNNEWNPSNNNQNFPHQVNKNIAKREYNKEIRALVKETGLSEVNARQLHGKLKGVKDNSERYRITDDFLSSKETQPKNVLNHGKSYQPSGANFPNTQGFSAEEIKSNQITQDLNAVKHNDAINKTLGHTFGKNPADLNKISTNSNFLNSNGYSLTSYSSSYYDDSKAAIRANNDRLTGAYNKAIEDNNVGSRYKKTLSSSDIQSKLDAYSTTRAGQSNLDRVTQRRQQLEEANKNRLMRNTARFNNELLSEKFKETAKNSYLNPSSQIRKMVNNLASSLPNYQSDSIAASFNGIATKETKSSHIDRFSRKIVDTINPNNNIVTDENKKYVEGALRQYEGYNRISGQGMNIDRMSEMSPNQIQKWKEMHREETSKYVRQIGGNIDPFDNMVEDKFGNYRPNEYTSKEGLDKLSRQMSGHRDELNWIDERLNSLNNQSSNSIISERGTSNNRYSSFFGTTDREQMNRLEFEELVSRKRELQDRLNKFDLGYTGEHINSDFTGPLREGEARPIIPASSPMGPNYTKDSFRPVYGTTGYGLGFKNAMAASGREHLARFAYFATPFGTGSGRQALMEAAGVLNRSQRLQASQARGFAKLGYAAVPATALGMVLMDMHEGKGPSEIAGDILSMGTALHGWRMGSSLGGATGSLLGQPGKFIGLGLGGVSGLIGGLVAGQALVSGISDAMSNDSQIRSYAKKAGTKEIYANTPETRQTLTARAAALQKLAKSGLNDRGLLLGNEATVLKGGM